MSKVFRLVQNEYINLIHKVSTWVIVAILILGSLFMPGVMKLSSFLNGLYTENVEQRIEDEIMWAEEENKDGVEDRIEWLNFYKTLEIKDSNDWRYFVMTNVIYIQQPKSIATGQLDFADDDYEKVVEKFKDSLTNNDYKLYYQAEIDFVKLTDPDGENALIKYTVEKNEYYIENEIIPGYSDWRYNEVPRYLNYKTSLEEFEEKIANKEPIDNAKYEETKEIFSVLEYKLNNNIEINLNGGLTDALNTMGPGRDANFWAVILASVTNVSFIGMLILVIAGGIVASEYSTGTIKFLLVNPVKRSKIIWSKYATVISLVYVFLAIMIIINFISTLILFGSNMGNAAYIDYVDGAIKNVSPLAYCLGMYLLNSIGVVVYATLAFSISSLMKSSGVAIGISLGVMLGGSTINSILAMLGFDAGRYLLFSNTEIATIAQGMSMFEAHGVGTAITVVAVHMVIMLLIAYDGFTRREV